MLRSPPPNAPKRRRQTAQGRVALAVTRQGSHRSGRARIRASGSSNQQLRHPRGSPKLFNQVTVTCLRTSMCSTCFARLSLLADASLPSTGSSGASSPASTVLSKRYDALLPSRRTSFPSLGGTSVALAAFAPWRTSAPPRPGVGNPVSPAGNSPRSEQGSPKFLGNHDCPFAHVPIRRRRDCLHQTVAVQQRGP